MTLSPKHLAKGAAVAALAASGLVLTQSAGADPKSASAYNGVGSDTTQDVLNALAGFNNGISYTPVQSSPISGQKQIQSWDATPAGTCIITKLGGPSFNRPNGSTEGRRALSRAIDGAGWTNGSVCAGATVVTGQIDFARSSAGPSGSGTALTYIPFGRDAVSYGYVSNGGTAVTTLTTAQLQNLYTNGSAAIGDQTVLACLPQTGSGTRKFFLGAIGVSDSTATTATTPNNCTLQENDGQALTDSLVGRPANTQLVIPFSAANYVSQSNGVAAASLGNVALGAIDALGQPTTGTAPNVAPSPTFYASTQYGRDVYNVFRASLVPAGPGGDAGLKSLFVGSGSAVCGSAAQATVNKFGFLSIAGCGSVSLQGPLVA